METFKSAAQQIHLKSECLMAKRSIGRPGPFCCIALICPVSTSVCSRRRTAGRSFSRRSPRCQLRPQANLPRVIDDKKVRPMDATAEMTVECLRGCGYQCRFRTTTGAGPFRSDFQLMFMLVVPPLRDCPEDLRCSSSTFSPAQVPRPASLQIKCDALACPRRYGWRVTYVSCTK